MKSRLAPAAYAVLIGCSSGSSTPGPAVERHDSAGVEVVRVLRLPSLAEPTPNWHLSLSREIPGGGGLQDETPIALYDPQGAVYVGNRLVVFDKGPERLVVFDSQNEIVSRFAPSGRGPGEIFGDGVTLAPNEDGTLTAVERWGNVRIHRFTLDGDLVNDRRVERISSGSGLGRTDREIVVQVWTPGSQSYVDSLAWLNVDRGTVEPFVGLPARYTSPEGRNPLFYPISMWTSFPTGSVLMGRTDSNVLRLYDQSGDLLRAIQIPISPMPVTEETAAKVLELYESFLASTRFTEEPERFHSHHRIAARLVAIDDTLFAMDHSWMTQAVEDHRLEVGVRVWRIFTVSGDPAGVVVFPKDFLPWGINDGVILGVRTDSLGVPTVEEYQLAPASG